MIFCKHPALTAALDETVSRSQGPLWDASRPAFDDLLLNFPNSPNVFHSRWVVGRSLILTENSDFVFIDPPGKKDWPDISDVIRRLRPGQSTMIWLPMGANTTEKPPTEDGVSSQCREEALRLGMSATAIRWAKGGHAIGCQLIYRLIPEAVTALRKVSEEVVRIAKLRSGTSSKWRYCPLHYDP